ncbi:MAG TPA: hypothetical protein VFJ57_09145 [Solirubrobacterales bacterium]|nr:hypothetical protein [Solirubrobacterales bacterium]
MSGPKTASGAAITAIVIALALSAFAVSNAAATGTTGYTCVKDAEGTLFGEHCLSSGSGEKYKHVEIKPGEQTTIAAGNEKTASGTTASQSVTIGATVSGVSLQITCSKAEGGGTFENKQNAGGEMYLHSEGSVDFTGCVVKTPAEKGCKVSGETIKTFQMTTTSEGQGHGVMVKPVEGTTITNIKIEGCSIAALNNTFPLTGSVKAQGNGATLTTTEAQVTTDNTLKFGGNKAGLECAMTVRAHSNAGEETHPVSVTTT